MLDLDIDCSLDDIQAAYIDMRKTLVKEDVSQNSLNIKCVGCGA
jgi:hypothetical protein